MASALTLDDLEGKWKTVGLPDLSSTTYIVEPKSYVAIPEQTDLSVVTASDGTYDYMFINNFLGQQIVGVVDLEAMTVTFWPQNFYAEATGYDFTLCKFEKSWWVEATEEEKGHYYVPEDSEGPITLELKEDCTLKFKNNEYFAFTGWESYYGYFGCTFERTGGFEPDAAAEKVIGTYDVSQFTGEWNYLFNDDEKDEDWHSFNLATGSGLDLIINSNTEVTPGTYEVKISSIGGNKVAVKGLWFRDAYSSTIIGEVSEDGKTITFTDQPIWGGYILCDNSIADLDQITENDIKPVVATIDEKGNISMVYTAEYSYYYENVFYCYIYGYDMNMVLEPKSEVTHDVTDILGKYTVEEFSGYTAYWYDDNTAWSQLDKSDYEVEITQVEGNKVALTGLVQSGLSFYGEYDPVDNTIVFPVQQIYGEDYPQYYLCVEEWDSESNMVFNPTQEMLGYFASDGSFDFGGWTILYVGDTSTFGYFSSVESHMVPGESGISNVNVAPADAPAVYYNIQGMRVNADNLRPGIYVEKKGNQTRKIMVK